MMGKPGVERASGQHAFAQNMESLHIVGCMDSVLEVTASPYM